MALAGWDNVRARATLPSFKCLAVIWSTITIESFIEEAVSGDLDAFKRDDKTLTTEMGPANVISSKLSVVARRAKISDSSFLNTSPEENLLDYPCLISAQFHIDNRI